MKRKQVRPIRRGGFPIIFSAVLLTALTLGSIGQAAPLSQTLLAQNPNDHYEMKVDPSKIKLCVGQTYDFLVTVAWVVSDVTAPLSSNQPAPTFNVYYAGEVVEAVSNSPIGSISPRDLQTSASTPGGAHHIPMQIGRRIGVSMVLVFTFTAEKVGTGPVEFRHWLARFGPNAQKQTAQVEVVECWEAYATGLWTGNKENKWTMKDICSLERPFVLEGSGVSEAGEARTVNKSQAFFFWPMEPFSVEGLSLPQQGRYIYAGLSTVTAFGLQSSCNSVGYGSYAMEDMLAPLVAGGVKEGNFVLNGQADRYCEGIPPAHLDKDVIEVAFRALKLVAGKVCQESLP